MTLSVAFAEVNFTNNEANSALQQALMLDEFVVFPILCFLAVACDGFFIATLYNMGLKRSSILLMMMVAFADVVQAIGLVGFVFNYFDSKENWIDIL